MGDIRVALGTTSSFSGGGDAGRMHSSSSSASSLIANVDVESLAAAHFLGGSVVGATPTSSSSIISSRSCARAATAASLGDFRVFVIGTCGVVT